MSWESWHQSGTLQTDHSSKPVDPQKYGQFDEVCVCALAKDLNCSGTGAILTWNQNPQPGCQSFLEHLELTSHNFYFFIPKITLIYHQNHQITTSIWSFKALVNSRGKTSAGQRLHCFRLVPARPSTNDKESPAMFRHPQIKESLDDLWISGHWINWMMVIETSKLHHGQSWIIMKGKGSLVCHMNPYEISQISKYQSVRVPVIFPTQNGDVRAVQGGAKS